MTTPPDDPRDDAERAGAWQAPDSPGSAADDAVAGDAARDGSIPDGSAPDDAAAEVAAPEPPGAMPQPPSAPGGPLMPGPATTPYDESPYGGTPYGQAPATSTKAIVSLVASLVFACGIGSAIGVITGHLARRDIKAAGGRLGGSGLALAGLIIGYLGLALSIIVGATAVIVAVNADDLARDLDAGAGGSQDGSEGRVERACPAPDALVDVVPTGSSFVLAGATRDPENGVLNCLYAKQGPESNSGAAVLLAFQDSFSTLSVDEYWSERSLQPPSEQQLGDAPEGADRFGYDEYPAPGSNEPYVDAGAALDAQSVVVSVPAAWSVPTPELFAFAVELLGDDSAPPGASA